MSNNDISLTKSLSCACGTYARSPELMRMHLAEMHCIPSDSQQAIIKQRIRDIHLERERLAVRFVALNNEERTMFDILSLDRHSVKSPQQLESDKRARVVREQMEEKRTRKVLKAAKGHNDVAGLLNDLLYGSADGAEDTTS